MRESDTSAREIETEKTTARERVRTWERVRATARVSVRRVSVRKRP